MTIARPVRRAIIRLLFQGWTAAAIARTGPLAPSRETVFRVRSRYHRHADFATPFDGRRPNRIGSIPRRILYGLINHLITVDCTLYLDEMSEWVWQQFGRRFRARTIGRALRRKGITRKVLTKIAARRCAFERASYHFYMQQYTADQVVYIDETRKDPRTLYRTHGRAYRFSRALARHSFTRASRGYSALGVLSIDGMLDCAITRASGVDAERFVQNFFDHVLPVLQPYPLPRSVLVLDNASIHLDPRIDAMVRGVGAILMPLPASSYDLNPIEKAFSKVKALLRRHRALSATRPRVALDTAMRSISASDARGYFRSCGWDV